MKRGTFILLVSTALAARVGFTAFGADLPSKAGAPEGLGGRALVMERCGSCHAFEGSGKEGILAQLGTRGPDLSYAGSKFRPGWMEDWLQAPTRIRPAGYLPFRYTVATEDGDRIDAGLLPDHPRLSLQEARSAAEFLATRLRPANPYPSSEPRPGLRPAVHFEKILPCGACHQARPGKGGVSAPELYRSRERLEKEWTLAFISDPPYWGPKPMPRVQVRSDLLVALGKYFFEGDGSAEGASSEAEVPPRKHDAPAPEPPALGELALGAEATGHGIPPSIPEDPGEGLYLMLCSQCHGITGNGKGINAPSMFVAPRDHTSFEEMAVLSDEHLFSTIKRGGTSVGKSALMPAWGGVLNDEEIRQVIAHLRRLSGTDS